MERRDALKKITSLTIICSMNPLELFSNSPNLFTSVNINTLKKEYRNAFISQFVNQRNISKLSDQELINLRYGITSLINITSTESFANKSVSRQLKILERKKPFISVSEIKKPDMVKVSGSFFKLASKTLDYFLKPSSTRDSLVLTANTLSMTMSGASCLLAIGATPATLGASALPAITSCGLFLYEATEFFNNVSRYGNPTRLRKIEETNTMLQLGHLNARMENVFGDFKFDKEEIFGNLDIDFNSQELDIEQVTTGLENEGFNNESERFLVEEVTKGNLFNSKEDFGSFLEVYLDKQGEEQLEKFKTYIEANRNKDIEKQQKQREEAFFAQSLNNFIAGITPQFMGEKESRLFNTLMSIGFQYSVASFGPMGWAAVGLNVASVLSNNQSDPQEAFRKALFKVLENIQKQLDAIIKGVEDLKYNQRAILNTLYKVLDEVRENRTVINDGFRKVTNKLNLIYELVKAVPRSNFENELAITISNLEDSLFGSSPINNNQEIRKLMQFSEQLDDPIFTLTTNEPLTGSKLTDLIFKGVTLESNSNLDVNILKPSNDVKFERSLYDVIGLLPTIANYSINFDFGQSNDLIVHPVHFSMLSNLTLNWCIASKMAKGPATDIHTRLNNKALRSKEIINKCSSINQINKKVKEYNAVFNRLIESMEIFLTDSIKIDFPKYIVLEQQSNFFNSNTYIHDLYSYNSHYKQENFRKYTRNHKISDLTINNFLTNPLDDNEYLKELNDWGFIDHIEVLSTKKTGYYYHKPRINNNFYGYPSTSNNNIIYTKKVKVTFKKIALFDQENIIPSFSFEYESAYQLSKFGNDDNMLLGLIIEEAITLISDNFNEQFDKVFIPINKFKVKAADTWLNSTFSNNQLSTNIDENGYPKTMGFAQFALNVKDNYTALKQKEYFNDFYTSSILNNSVFEGIATSLMVQTQTNKTITNNKVYPYSIDYSDEIIHKKDFLDLFHKIFFQRKFTKFLKPTDDLNSLISLPNFSTKLCKSMILSNNVALTTEEYMSSHRYILEVITNLLAAQHNTIISLYKDCKIIRGTDALPFLDDCLNKLNWFKEEYLRLE